MENVNYSNQKIAKPSHYFNSVVFNGETNFRSSLFINDADFNLSVFQNRTFFNSAVFQDLTKFSDTEFKSITEFEKANFHSYTTFEYAKFLSKVTFEKTSFDSIVHFSSSQFNSYVIFELTQFHDDAYFDDVTFISDTLIGFDTLFSKEEKLLKGKLYLSEPEITVVSFSGSRFYSVSNFSFSEFYARSFFFEVLFDSIADFGNTIFHSYTDFSDSEFKSFGGFFWTNFKSEALFEGVNFYSPVAFVEASFDSTISFFDARFHKIVDFASSKFYGFTEFTGALFEDTVFFQESIFHNDIDFSGTKFNEVVFMNNIDFQGDVIFDATVLPQYLFFCDNRITGTEVDFTRTIINPRSERCAICLVRSDISKIKLRYERFKLWFPSLYDSNDFEIKSNVYEDLLRKQKEDGFIKSYEILDKEYREFQYTDPNGPYTLIGGHLKNWFWKKWWGYGYDKDLILRNTLFIYLLFSIVNIFCLKWLVTKVYTIDMIEIWRDRSHYSKAARFFISIPYSFFYTGVIFFGLKFSLDKLHYSSNLKGFRWFSLIYFFSIYLAGLFCLAFLANYIITF